MHEKVKQMMKNLHEHSLLPPAKLRVKKRSTKGQLRKKTGAPCWSIFLLI